MNMNIFLENYTLLTSIDQFIIIGIIILISQIIYSTLGFGSGMFAVSILSYLYGNIEFIVPFFTVLCFPTELFISYKNRKEIDFRQIKRFLYYIIPSLLLGTVLLKYADNSNNSIYLILLGVLIILVSVNALSGFLEKKDLNLSKDKLWIPIFGSISGILGGLYAIAGPPLIFYFQQKKLNKSKFRITLMSIFSAMSVMRILFYFVLNILTVNLLTTAAIMLPFSFLGLTIGNSIHNKIDEKIFKIIVSVVLAISGIMLIVKNT